MTTLQFIILGFTISTFFFGIYAKIKELPKDLIRRYFTCSNMMAAAAAIAIIVTLILDLMQASADSTYLSFRKAVYGLAIVIAFSSCAPMLFREYRGLWRTGLLMSLVLCMSVFMETLHFFTRVYQHDNLPSSWSYYSNTPINFWLIAAYSAVAYFAIVYGMVWIWNKMSEDDDD